MIFFFSCTGNSRWVAELVAKQTDDRLMDMTVLLKGECRFRLAEDESVGFIFPIHGWRVPKLVLEFMDRLVLEPHDAGCLKRHSSFCLVTAGDSIGEAMERFSARLKLVQAGTMLSLEMVGSVIMPESYVGLPGMDVDKPKKEQQKIATAAERILAFCEVLHIRKQNQPAMDFEKTFLVKGPIPKFFSNIVGGFFERYLITDRYFKVDEAKCVHCGICKRVCPVENVQSGCDEATRWLHNGRCLTCFACYHHCPKRAIEYGRRTRTKGQYYFKKHKIDI